MGGTSRPISVAFRSAKVSFFRGAKGDTNGSQSPQRAPSKASRIGIAPPLTQCMGCNAASLFSCAVWSQALARGSPPLAMVLRSIRPGGRHDRNAMHGMQCRITFLAPVWPQALALGISAPLRLPVEASVQVVAMTITQ